MPHPEQQFRWSWELSAAPEALWPWVANTDRFNRDCGYPAVTPVAVPNQPPHVRRLRTRVLGIPIEWDESAFEWVMPQRFGAERRYHRGPVARMIVACELVPRRDGGTTLVYTMRITPAGWFGRLALPVAIGFDARRKMDRVFRRYDELARRQQPHAALRPGRNLAPGGGERLSRIAASLVTEHQQPASLVGELEQLLVAGDDQALGRIRPYAIADAWGAPRRQTLHLFLHATRAGLLDFSWDLVCPHCRGAKAGGSHLGTITAQAHCESCGIDFTANFDRSVELTFTPNPAIRPITRATFCVGGPHLTPHVVAQQTLAAGSRTRLPLDVPPGGYRVRAPGLPAQAPFRVAAEGVAELEIAIAAPPDDPASVAPGGALVLTNPSAEPRLAVVEHLAWTDQATTAADVTSLQLFRDLFSREVLRAGERLDVGSLAIVFTDLKDSTHLYQQIGDAPAFGRVLTHFDVLRAVVAEEDGCIVKTMGDAIMAAFTRPVCAVRAMIRAQQWLADPEAAVTKAGAQEIRLAAPLRLKCGIHSGPCLAINQNDRLDYFGTTVNIAARLCGVSSGTDVVLSDAVAADPEVAAECQRTAAALAGEQVQLKGFGENRFAIHRLTAGTGPRARHQSP